MDGDPPKKRRSGKRKPGADRSLEYAKNAQRRKRQREDAAEQLRGQQRAELRKQARAREAEHRAVLKIVDQMRPWILPGPNGEEPEMTAQLANSIRCSSKHFLKVASDRLSSTQHGALPLEL